VFADARKMGWPSLASGKKRERMVDVRFAKGKKKRIILD